eukprot:7155810-Pyramimonas_sp.AAC.1
MRGSAPAAPSMASTKLRAPRGSFLGPLEQSRRVLTLTAQTVKHALAAPRRGGAVLEPLGHTTEGAHE